MARDYEKIPPKDFFAEDEWPHGDLTPPAAFEAYDFAEGEREQWLNCIRWHVELVRDYRHHVRGTKRDTVARDLGLTPSTLSAFNKGNKIGDGVTYLKLRATIAPRPPEVDLAEERRAAVRDFLESDEVKGELTAGLRQLVPALLREALRDLREARTPGAPPRGQPPRR